MSKGSKRRPRSVPADKFSDNWDRIFNKPNKEDADARQKAGRVRKESP